MPKNDFQFKTLTSSGDNHDLIAPGPNELPQIYKAILFESAGTATLEDERGIALPYTRAAGQPLNMRPRKVLSSTATLYGVF